MKTDVQPDSTIMSMVMEAMEEDKVDGRLTQVNSAHERSVHSGCLPV